MSYTSSNTTSDTSTVEYRIEDTIFHLVLVHGVGDVLPVREKANAFWTSRFEDAVVTNFIVAAEGIEWGSRGLVHRAQEFLEVLHRVHAARLDSSGDDQKKDHAPYVFLCHDLGGCLVKQALVLASQDKRFSFLTTDTVLLILCGTPSGMGPEVLRFLSGLDGASSAPLEMLHELPATLNELSLSFAGIEPNFTIIEDTASEEVVSQDSDIRPSFFKRPRISIPSDSGKGGEWDFAPDISKAERIFDLISQAVKLEFRPISRKYHDFLRFLERVSPSNHQVELTKPFPNSLNWITEHPSYLEWRKPDAEGSSILYIHGPYGSGSSAIAYHLMTTFQAASDSTVISFSFSKHDSRTQPITGFYVSLIRQLLLSHPLLFGLVSYVAILIQEENVFSYEILRSLLLVLLKGISRGSSILFIIRGVEECMAFPFDHIIDLIDEYEKLSSANLKVAVFDVKPPQGAFLGGSKVCHTLDLSSETWRSAAVRIHTETRINKLARHRQEWGFYKDMVLENVCKASETVLQASLAMSFLESAKIPSTRASLIKTVSTIPPSLDALYERALSRCQSEFFIPLLPLLQWIQHSTRPLTIREVAVVAALALPEPVTMDRLKVNVPIRIADDLRPLLGTLIKLSGLQVRPIHSTIASVLDTQLRLAGHDADEEVLQLCLDYLEVTLEHFSTTGINSRSQGGPELDLLEYAVTSWPEHYRRCVDRSKVRVRTLELFSKEKFAEIWFALYEEYNGPQPKTYSALDSQLNIACRFGLEDMAREALAQAERDDEASHREFVSQALELASGYGHKNIVAMLLEADAFSSEAAGLAAVNGFLDVVKVLVEAHPDLVDGRNKQNRPPFALAALNGNEEIAAYLLEKGANCNVAVAENITPLHLAVATGQVRLSRLLIEAGIDITATNSAGYNALHLASRGGFDYIVKLLLDLGAQINDQAGEGKTALHLAAECGHISTCNILLDAGADNLIETEVNQSPLHIASAGGYLSIVKQLILRSPKAEAGKAHSGAEEKEEEDLIDYKVVASPIQLAATNGHLEVVRELLKHPQYGSARDCALALLKASSGGFGDLVSELLRFGITLIARDGKGDTALHLAALRRHPSIVRQLLDAKVGSDGLFNIDTVNNDRETPLYHAADTGRLQTVQMLLNRGADMSCRNNLGATALHSAAGSGHVYIVNEILKRLASDEDEMREFMFGKADQGHSPFFKAVLGGHTAVTQALITAYSSIAKPQELQRQQNALLIATDSGSEDMVLLILRHGWDINSTGSESEQTALHVAAQNGSVAMIKLLIKHGADLNARDVKEETPLRRALYSSKIEALEALLEAGADLNAADKDGVTVLWDAAYDGEVEIVKLLLKWSPDLEARKSLTGWTALHAALDDDEVTRMLLANGANPMAPDVSLCPPFFLAAGHFKGDVTIRRYLEAGTDITYTAPDGTTALHFAAPTGDMETVKLLVEQGANVNARKENGDTPLFKAAYGGEPSIVQYLLDNGADPDAESSIGRPLMVNDDIPTLTVLLEAKANVNATSDKCPGFTALQVAASKGSADAVRLLLDYGADPNICGGSNGSPLVAAVGEKSVEITKMLLEAGADINYRGGPKGTALERNICRHCDEITSILLEDERIDVNAVSATGRTPLLMAVSRGTKEEVELLLRSGADPNLGSQDASSDTPLQAAVRRGSPNYVELLVDNGADLTCKDAMGRGPLANCIVSTSMRVLPYLLARPETNINEQDVNMQTPLIHAANRINRRAIQKLLEHGADINLQDTWGNTALNYAIFSGYHGTVKQLIAAGANPLLKDIRGRDALYWASYVSTTKPFEELLAAARSLNAAPSVFQHAISGAVTANNSPFVEALLQEVQYTHSQADADGWTALYAAQMYHRQPIASLIEEAAIHAGRLRSESTARPIPPSAWHTKDLATTLGLRADGRTIIATPKNTHDKYWKDIYRDDMYAVARADHPMIPGDQGVYYFEVVIEKTGPDNGAIAIGFCEEIMDLRAMLGRIDSSWYCRSWCYDSTDGEARMTDGQQDKRSPYGPVFGDGDTIGCGVNFEKQTVFFTKNGEIIGRAFSKICGKLFPAISVEMGPAGCRIFAKFMQFGADAGDIERSPSFGFKGDYKDPRTLEDSPVSLRAAGAGRGRAESESHSSPDSDDENSSNGSEWDDEVAD